MILHNIYYADGLRDAILFPKYMPEINTLYEMRKVFHDMPEEVELFIKEYNQGYSDGLEYLISLDEGD